MIDTYFDSILCINLDRRRDRWAEAQEELRLCEIRRCERFSAIDDPRGYRGCTASHLTIWRRIASGALGERVLVLEDDFKLITRGDLIDAGHALDSDVMKSFDACPGATLRERFEAMVPSIPLHWDLLYLGGSYIEKQRARVNKHIVRNAGMSCGHSYGMSRAYAEKVAAYFAMRFPQDDCAEAPDVMLRGFGSDPSVVSYTLTPRLFVQRHTSPSDLVPRPSGFPHSMVDVFYEPPE